MISSRWNSSIAPRTWKTSRPVGVVVSMCCLRTTMIAEIPRPGCVSSSSLWKAGITAARNYVTGRYWVSLYRWHYLYKKIDIKGLGFFDEEHDVTGAAPNKIELHPVIYIRVR
jgi:hypothetical protein